MIWDYRNPFKPSLSDDEVIVSPTLPWTPGGFNSANIYVKSNDSEIPLSWDILLDTPTIYTSLGNAFKSTLGDRILFNTSSYSNGGETTIQYRRTDGYNISLYGNINIYVALLSNILFPQTESRTGNIILHYYFGENTGICSIEFSAQNAATVFIYYNDILQDTQVIGSGGGTGTISFDKTDSNIRTAKLQINTTGKWGIHNVIIP